MKVSTNLPSGWTAIKKHLAEDTTLVRNVGEEADLAFMRELEREDPQRYHRLMRNIFARGRADKDNCQKCGLALPFKDRRSDTKYCDDACKKSAWRSRKAA